MKTMCSFLCCSSKKHRINDQTPSVPEIIHLDELPVGNDDRSTREDLKLCNERVAGQIVKVNGQDLTGASHEEAIKVFRAAKEPIIVEVLKRPTNVQLKKQTAAECLKNNMSASSGSPVTSDTLQSKDESPSPPPTPPDVTSNEEVTTPEQVTATFNDVATQTESNSACTLPYGTQTSRLMVHPAFLPSVLGLQSPNGSELCDADSFFNYIPPAYLMEYEEVSLKRSNADNERLGLTLCYGSPEDTETDIFISEIDPDGIAATSGRISVGDQILQINNVDVNTREQAISLFTESKTEITLLLARPQLHLDDFVVDEVDAQVDKETTVQTIDEEEDGTTDTGTGENGSTKHEKDSGVGRTDENEESSDRDDLHNSDESFTSHGGAEYEDKCIGTSNVDLAHDDGYGLTNACSQANIDRELALLNQEMKNIQIECQSLVQKHADNNTKNKNNYANVITPVCEKTPTTGSSYDKSRSIAEWVRSTSRNVRPIKISSEENNTSSAYNTGDSCRSTPLTMELHADRRRHGSTMSLLPPLPATDEKGTQFVTARAEDLYSSYSCESCRQCRQERERRRDKRSDTGRHDYNTLPSRCRSGSGSRSVVSVVPSETMYTNEENLQQTIWLQQQMFLQAIQQQRQPQQRTIAKMEFHDKKPSNGCRSPQSSRQRGEVQMEWRVKRRPDGSRYVTRRPVRNRILKQREQKIMEERTGITTDDDAISELKVGRYWTKEDRKRQLEEAKMYKLQREMALKTKRLDKIKELEQTNLKQPRKKNLEEFVNAHEIIDNKSVVCNTSANCGGGLLSVTTV